MGVGIRENSFELCDGANAGLQREVRNARTVGRTSTLCLRNRLTIE